MFLESSIAVSSSPELSRTIGILVSAVKQRGRDFIIARYRPGVKNEDLTLYLFYIFKGLGGFAK